MWSIKRIFFRMSLVFSAFIFLNYCRNFTTLSEEKNKLHDVKITLIKAHSEEEKKLDEVKITLIKAHSEEEKKQHEVKSTLTETHSEVKKKLHEKEKLLGWRRNVQWESKLDQHEYRYLINQENGCKKSESITLLICVISKMSGAKQRNVIRETYGAAVVKYNVSAKIFFLTGISGDYNSTLQAQLQSEADIHGDILQEDFIDSYYNLTTKLIMAAKWASTFCKNSNYVMSIDDDVTLDIVNLVSDLEANVVLSKFVLAEPTFGWKPIRNPGNKWYTPYELYPKKTWPPFPRGYAYILSIDVANDIYRASQKLAAPIPWEDVYCGMLLQAVGVKMTDIMSWFQTRHGHEKQVAPLGARDHYAIWDKPPIRSWTAIIEQRYKNIHL
eukprot:XP_011662673.1 PREDICTED: beta-1,3-galactosyltransferase 1-like [Strongylocentrotus purpuratus]